MTNPNNIQQYLDKSLSFEVLMNMISDDFELDYKELSELSISALSDVVIKLKGGMYGKR